MHFSTVFTSILLAATAVASPLGLRNTTLAKRGRQDSDGQAGVFITAEQGVSFAYLYGCKTSRNLPDTRLDPFRLCSETAGD